MLDRTIRGGQVQPFIGCSASYGAKLIDALILVAGGGCTGMTVGLYRMIVAKGSIP